MAKAANTQRIIAAATTEDLRRSRNSYARLDNAAAHAIVAMIGTELIHRTEG